MKQNKAGVSLILAIAMGFGQTTEGSMIQAASSGGPAFEVTESIPGAKNMLSSFLSPSEWDLLKLLGIRRGTSGKSSEMLPPQAVLGRDPAQAVFGRLQAERVFAISA